MPLELKDLEESTIIKTLTGQMTEMGKLVRGLVSIQQQQTAVITELRTKQATAPTAHNEPNDDDDDDDVDVNSLDNAGFQKFLMKEIGGLLDEKISVLGTKIDGTVTAINNKEVKEQYADLKKDHPDVDEWIDEMKALQKGNPGLSLKQLLTLAKSEDSKKAKEMDEKYVKKADGKDKADTGLTMFGGFRPTIGKTSGDDAGKGAAKMTAEEAGSKAWEETVAKFPGLAALETNPLD